MEEETKPADRVAWGTGRVVFLTNLPAIQELVEAGWPITAVYQRLKDSLAGVSYRQFSRYVRNRFPAKWKLAEMKQAVTARVIASDGIAPVVQSPIQRGAANDEKPKGPGRPAKFRPGPRIPNPKDLY